MCLPPLPAALMMMKVGGANMKLLSNQSFSKPRQRSDEARFGVARKQHERGARAGPKPLGEGGPRVFVCCRHLVEVVNRIRTGNKVGRKGGQQRPDDERPPLKEGGLGGSGRMMTALWRASDHLRQLR